MDQRLGFLLKNSNDILCVTDLKGNIISVNKSWVHFTGYSEGESKSKNLVLLTNPQDRDKLIELYTSIPSLSDVDDISARINSNYGGFLNIKWSLCYDHAKQLIYAVGIYSNGELHISNPYNISDKVQHVLANISESFVMLDNKWCLNGFNPAFQRLVNIPADVLRGVDFRQIDKLALTDQVIPEFEKVYQTGKPSSLKYYDSKYKGWLRLNIYPYKGELIIFIRDISNNKIEQLILTLEKSVLQHNLIPDYSLSKIADELLMGIEDIFPDMYCSILEVDPEQERVYHLSAPRLPKQYTEAINGKKIGPKAGSCGAAAYHREKVIVKSIAESPLWDDYREYILPFGFKACWSTPVISSHSTKVLATYAVYYNTEREPGRDEVKIIERTTTIVRSLIESKRNEADLAEQTRRLHEIASISSHEIRRPVATILGLVNLFDRNNPGSSLNKEIIGHLETTALELDAVIHIIVEKTISI
jgi:PAS domain S-box-containing protein